MNRVLSHLVTPLQDVVMLLYNFAPRRPEVLMLTHLTHYRISTDVHRQI